jgi:cytoskeletal protein CcmA (bactofilin family)
MFSRGNKGSRPAPGAPTVVGAETKFLGDIVSNASVHVDGEVTGDIRCQTLMIGAAGSVTGEIEASEAEIFGSLNGRLQARNVFLAKTAKILGDIFHESLEVEAGAQVEGRWSRLEMAKAIEAVKDVTPAARLSPPQTTSEPEPPKFSKRSNGYGQESLDEEAQAQAS